MKVNKATIALITLFISIIALASTSSGQQEIPLKGFHVRTVLLPGDPGPDQRDELRIKVEFLAPVNVNINPMKNDVNVRYRAHFPWDPPEYSLEFPSNCWEEHPRFGFVLVAVNCVITASILDSNGQELASEEITEASARLGKVGSVEEWRFRFRGEGKLLRPAMIADEVRFSVGNGDGDLVGSDVLNRVHAEYGGGISHLDQ